MKKIRMGLIGFGGISKGVHVPGYLAHPDKVEITAVCDINPERLSEAKEKFGLSDSALFADYRELLNSRLVDAVDIATSNDSHVEIAMAAIEKGLPFSIEKPIGRNLDEAKKLFELAEAKKCKSFVCFSWRYRAYARLLRDIVKSGELGKIYHIYIRCIKDSGLWKGRRLEWRFDKEKAGSGVLGDLGSHMIDITRFIGEEFDTVFAQSGIFVERRQVENGDEIKPVTTDDWCNISAITKNGVPVTVNLSRVAKTIPDLMEFEIIGEGGRVKLSFSGTMKMYIGIGKWDTECNGMHEIVPPASYNANQSLSFINLINGIEDEYTSHIIEGIECQKVLEAASRSIETGKAVKIEEEIL
mgnify:FL=1